MPDIAHALPEVPNEHDDVLLRDWEACKYLGLSKTQTWNMMSSGTLPGVVRMGRSIRVSKKAVQRWIAAQVEGTGQ